MYIYICIYIYVCICKYTYIYTCICIKYIPTLINIIVKKQRFVWADYMRFFKIRFWTFPRGAEENQNFWVLNGNCHINIHIYMYIYVYIHTSTHQHRNYRKEVTRLFHMCDMTPSYV